ncbi:galactoside O-acetyltransferase [Xylaria bambusicola]|uniref:galactoside O-acetyltransferase n=1 Tax=Xylaria bambusicola TaxID=326684 RepID=UPI0020079C8E|nr:galactoside O-acetyltransferase [Xylaria bambusicola]KAI0528051.1 galactoside O-acetyltransferase [Xylaria bambusicola]
MALRAVDPEENKRRMINGDLYFAFTPDLIADRKKCRQAYERFNAAGEAPRRTLIELFQKIVDDKTPLPPQAGTPEDDEDLLGDFPWIDRPVKMDYGYNVKVGKSAYINCNSTWIDTCTITIGARTLIGPNCSFFSGNHPTDPRVRNGTNGPEDGAPIVIGEDCWLGGNVIVLRGVTIGRGTTIGAGSVVTKDIPPFMVAAGNPARVLKPIREVPTEELPPGWSPPENIPVSEA